MGEGVKEEGKRRKRTAMEKGKVVISGRVGEEVILKVGGEDNSSKGIDQRKEGEREGGGAKVLLEWKGREMGWDSFEGKRA